MEFGESDGSGSWENEDDSENSEAADYLILSKIVQRQILQ